MANGIMAVNSGRTAEAEASQHKKEIGGTNQRDMTHKRQDSKKLLGIVKTENLRRYSFLY